MITPPEISAIFTILEKGPDKVLRHVLNSPFSRSKGSTFNDNGQVHQTTHKPKRVAKKGL